MEVLLNQVFALRSRLLKLRRTIVPMRDLMYRVLNSQHIQGRRSRECTSRISMIIC